jgi:hypothetical protein
LIPNRVNVFLYAIASRPALGSNLLSEGYGKALSPGVKLPGREPDYSTPSSVEVKNDGCEEWFI